MTLEQVSLFDTLSTPRLSLVPAHSPTITLSRDEAWAAFWRAYPRKVGKPDAKKAFDGTKAVAGAWERAGGDVQMMLSTIEAWRAEWEARPQFCPYPATWLRRDGWEDDAPVTPGVELAGPKLGASMSALARWRQRQES